GEQLFHLAFGLAQLLGEFGGDFRQNALGYFTHRDRRLGGLARHPAAAVVLRESERGGLLFADLRTGDSRCKLSQHTRLAKDEREVFGLPAFEFLAVDAADEIQRDAIALTGRTVFAGLVDSALLAQDVDGTLDVRIGHFAMATRDGQRGEVGRLDLGIDFERGGEGQRALLNAFRLGFQARRTGNAQLGLAQHLFQVAADLFVDHVVADARPMAALDDGQRSLPRAKALHLGAARDAFQLGLYFLLDVG